MVMLMDVNELYPIEQYPMTKNRCYKANKRRTPTGIQVHSVGCKGTNRDRWRKWNTDTIKKCASAIVDTKGIMQCLDWDVRPWLSGSGKNGNANDWCTGFEICEPSTSKDTPEAAAYLYGCTLYLCTELCREYGIHPANIKCHSELHRAGVASNHADVTHWWGKKGTSWEPYTMNRLRRDVAEALGMSLSDNMNEVISYMNVLKRGSKGDNVETLQTNLNAIGFSCGTPDGKFGPATEAAVIKFQASAGLVTDGIVGDITQAAIANALKKKAGSEPTQRPKALEATQADILNAKIGDLQTAIEELTRRIDALEKQIERGETDA